MTRPTHLRLVVDAAAPEPGGEASDDALMSLAAAGQLRAFEALVERHEARLRRFCTMLANDEALGRDLAQEVFLRLWETRARYRPTGRLRELLFTVARNLARTHHRRQAVRTLFGLLHAPAEAEEGPDPLVGSERAALVQAALRRLPEKFRVPLALRFYEELPYDEIARVIGRTESAARSRVFYGLRELAKLLPAQVLS